jgi:hypothetical protein
MSLEDGNSGDLSNQASLGSEPAQSSAAASSSSERPKTSSNGSSDGWIPDVGSVVLAKLKGFPQWPAMVSTAKCTAQIHPCGGNQHSLFNTVTTFS